jgi:hypothetical protein
MVYALGPAGQALIRLHPIGYGIPATRLRRTVPGDRFTRHVLAVSELCVRLMEHLPRHGCTLEDYQAEPDCWQPDGPGGLIKPDAYAVLSRPDGVTDHWWIEIDLATETISTLRAQLSAYLAFHHRGQTGPGHVMPRVLVTVPSHARREALSRAVRTLPEPARQLITVTTFDHAATVMADQLRE